MKGLGAAMIFAGILVIVWSLRAYPGATNPNSGSTDTTNSNLGDSNSSTGPASPAPHRF